MSFSKIQAFLVLLLCAAITNADAKPYASGKYELSLSRRSVVESLSPSGPLVDNSSFVLAAERTSRKDPFNGYIHYTGGWNISDEHYWASVGYSAFPLFITAVVWFVVFGFLLVIMCCVCCCFRRGSYSYSRMANALSIILLILFTCAAVTGCCIIYRGQGQFHHSTSITMDYVEGQANITVENLQNFSRSLAAAKNIDVNHILLPSDVQGKIDALRTKLNKSANTLSTRSSSNIEKIHDTLDTLQVILIVVAALMLLLAFLGLLFSALGLQFLVYILVIIAWVLVAGTFILCGVSLLFHNVVADTCVAMDDWVHHPHAYTALDDILPCVDTATANESMNQSKRVTFQLVTLINRAILNISNADFLPLAPPPLNYNQSGPLVPALCNPYLPDMSGRACLAEEVNFDNANQVWQRYVCNSKVVDGNEICITAGRLTPTLYGQIKASANVSHGLYRYTPFLTQLVNCGFVRETFSKISTDNCPGLSGYSKWVYIGLLIVSVALMLSLVFWVIYVRERRHRKYNKQFIARAGDSPLVGRDKV